MSSAPFIPRFRYDSQGVIVDRRKSDPIVDLAKIPPRESMIRAPNPTAEILSANERGELMPRGEPLSLDLLRRAGGDVVRGARAIPQLARVAGANILTSIPQSIEMAAGAGSAARAALSGEPILPAFEAGARDVRGRIPLGEESAQLIEEADTAALEAGAPLLAILAASAGLPSGAARLPAKAARKIAKRGMAAVDFRSMPAAAAHAAARKGAHLIPDAKTGQFVGAPRGFTSIEQIEAQRAEFDKLVEEGMAGARWYHKMAGTIEETAGSDPAKQDLLAARLALYSPQSTPETNLGFTIEDWNARVAQQPPKLKSGNIGVRTPMQWRQSADLRVKPAASILGPKTGVYYTQGNPARRPTHTGTNDIFHARAFGFWEPDKKTGAPRPWSSGLTKQQHTYLDGETLLAIDRANAKQLGGRADWDARQVQAAAWIAAKARSLMSQRPKLTHAQALEEATKGYGDFIAKHTAAIPTEEVPGLAAGHLPQMVDEPFDVKRAYAGEGWADDQGRDILTSAQGMLNRPMREGTGSYTPTGGGELQVSPTRVVRPLVSLDPRTKSVRSRDLDLLEEQSLFRGAMEAQEGVAPHFATTRGKESRKQGLRIPLNRQLTEQESRELTAIANANSLWVADTGEGVTLGPFKSKSRGTILRRAMKKTDLPERIEEIVGVRPELARVDSRYVDLTGDWQKSAESLEAAPITERLLAREPQMARFDTPAVRDKVLRNYTRDLDFAKRGFQVNEKLQNLRHAFGTGGWDSVKKALKAGVPLPAVGVMMRELGGEGEGA